MYTQQSYLYEEGFFTLVLVLVLEDEVPSISTTGPLQEEGDKKEEGKEETDREGMGRVGAGRGGGRREREE